MIKFKTNSLSAKIFLSFFILGLFLLTLLFLQIIPNLQEKEKKHTIKQIESMINLINQQLILATKSIKSGGTSRREELKSIMEHEANRISSRIIEKKDFTIIRKKKNQFKSKKISCNTSILDYDKSIIYQIKKESFKNVSNYLRDNSFFRYDQKSIYVCPSGLRELYFTKKISALKKYLVISCDIDKFQAPSRNIEKVLKKDIQKSFAQMKDFHKGKTYLMWINIKNVKNSSKPLYEKGDDYFYNKKFCLSKISNLRYPQTGKLSGKQILLAADKKPIKHLLNSKGNTLVFDKNTLTWVRTIYKNNDVAFLYITSIFEKDFLQHIDSSFYKIFPAAILSFLVAIILALILFKRLFKSINVLTNTAIQINQGKTNLRSNIKGNDDIALLGKAFDNMLDSLEDNISQLDNKVEEKTKLLSNSLKEKETLLKEIHHRVKNNLAITINLIKLEKSKISNKSTNESLTNIEERVHAMELLHRKLYESEDLRVISLKKYIHELTNDLKKSYVHNKNIKILCFIDNVHLSIDYAMPSGLVISELVTNSLKYAFKDEGEIKIIIKIQKSLCYICVWDNGKGLDKNIDIKNTQSLGLQIVSNITKGQLFGEFNYTYENGAKFEITFDLENENL